MKRLRQIFESIAYAGMKPASSASDPLYLTNRTFGQKVRLALVIVVPFLAVLVGVGMAALGYLDNPKRLPPPARQLTDAELAAKMLPDLDKNITLDTNKNLEVVEVQVHHAGGGKISGTVRNNSDHVINEAEVIFDLTDADGSRVGAVSCKVGRIEPGGRARFETAIYQTDALFAIVREIYDR